MKLTLEGTPDEIKKALQAISGSQERNMGILDINDKPLIFENEDGNKYRLFLVEQRARVNTYWE
ncbi:hypothetical protein [Lacticaseibacillus saniviri]